MATQQVLIASDREDMSRRIRDILEQHALECPAGHVVPIDAVADRAGRVAPALLLFAMPPNASAMAAVLRDARRTAPKAYMVAIGPANDEERIVRTLDEGVDEYLDESILETEMSGMIARFKTQAEPENVQTTAGWVIAVLSPSGGSGASVVAANLSVTLAKEHGQCGLVDLRLSAGDLASMLDLRPTQSVADACEHVARIDRSMLEQFFVRHASGVFLLAAPSQLADVRRVNAKGIRQTFAMARLRFPYLVVDLDNVIDPEQTEALWQADVVLLMLRLDYTSVRNTRRVLDHLECLGIQLDRVRLVANGCGERKQLSPAQAEEALEMKIWHSIPSEPAVILSAINNGVPAVLRHPSAKVSRSLSKLALNCNGHFPKGLVSK